MNNSAIPLVQTQDRNINQLQSNIVPKLNNISNNDILQNNFLTGVSLSSGDNEINHGLNRIPKGWIITDKDGNANIYRYKDSTNEKLYLNSSASITAGIMVF